MKIVRSNSDNEDFIQLVKKLDEELAERDGKEHEFYHQFNNIDLLKYVLIAYEKNTPIACGAIKKIDDSTAEVKRMYVHKDYRNKGFASSVLNELERWASEQGFSKCVLETGIRQPEAIALYLKNGFQSIPNYGQYVGIENSKCFEKWL